jgi:hypothetical protein
VENTALSLKVAAAGLVAFLDWIRTGVRGIGF